MQQLASRTINHLNESSIRVFEVVRSIERPDTLMQDRAPRDQCHLGESALMRSGDGLRDRNYDRQAELRYEVCDPDTGWLGKPYFPDRDQSAGAAEENTEGK